MSLLDTASLIVTPNGYKEGKLYSVIPSDGSGDLSVTRATTATRVNSAGLVELVPYNLVQYSQEFTNGVWGAAGYGNVATIVANDTTAPDGTMTASKATFTAAGTQGRLVQSISTTNGQAYNASFYVKQGNKTTINFYSDAAVFGTFITFNFNTGTITNSNNVYGSDVDNVGNGWYRISFWSYAPSSTAQFGFITFGGEDGFCYIWGSQFEQNTTATTYQKTETRLNIPRLDYSNGTCPSILVEPQRTNLFLYSSSFDSAAWNYVSAVKTPNATISPSGNADAQQLEFNSGYIFTSAVTSASATSSISCYAKKGTANTFVIQEANYVGTSVTFDLNNGTVTSGTGTIEDVGNGWYRCTTQFAYGSGQTTATWAFRNYQSGYIYLWGAQLEVGSYATSYIPTTSASVTRNADVISKTGISSLIGQTEGTIFIDLDFTDASISMLLQLFDGASDVMAIYTGSNSVFFDGSNGSAQWSISGSLPNGHHKLALAYKANDIAVYIDGILVGTDTSAAVPTTDQLYLNANVYQSFIEKQRFNAVALWKTRLSNTQLAQLTTI